MDCELYFIFIYIYKKKVKSTYKKKHVYFCNFVSTHKIEFLLKKSTKKNWRKK